MSPQIGKGTSTCLLAILWQLVFAGGFGITLSRMLFFRGTVPDHLLMVSALALTLCSAPFLWHFLAARRERTATLYFLSLFAASATVGLLGVGSGFGAWQLASTEAALLVLGGISTALATRWIWDSRTGREDIGVLDLADHLDRLKRRFEVVADAMRRLAETPATDSYEVEVRAGLITSRLNELIGAHRDIREKMRRSIRSGVLFLPESIRFRCHKTIDAVGRAARDSYETYAKLKKERTLLPHTTHVQFDEAIANILPRLTELTDQLRGDSGPALYDTAMGSTKADHENYAAPSTRASPSIAQVRASDPTKALPEPARIVTSDDHLTEAGVRDEEAEREAEAEEEANALPRAGRT